MLRFNIAVLAGALLFPASAFAASSEGGPRFIVESSDSAKAKKKKRATRAAAPAGAPNPAGSTDTARTPRTPYTGPQPHGHKGPEGCQFYGATACEDCLLFWAHQGDAMNNHMCKDKSRANGTKGWDCFNFAEDTSHGYECIAYCPPETPTCESNCDQKLAGGAPYHDHPMRQTRNKNTGRILGPPGFAPEPHKGREERAKCVW